MQPNPIQPKARRPLHAVAAALIATGLAACAADAKSPAGEVPPVKPPMNAPQVTAPDGSGNLSEQLSRSNGVIEPKQIDPEMVQPPPETGAKTPVIPPPGTPGGNPDVQPK
jgi:hypothetical protein